MLENMIFDRTQQNVDKLKELSKLRYQDMTDEQKQAWVDNLKGCLRYTDLNRVEEGIVLVGEKIKQAGFSVSLLPKKEWTKDDIPKSSDIERMLTNIGRIRDIGIYMTHTPEAPTDVRLDWSKANDIERILYDVELMLVPKTETYIYCGEIISGGGYQ